MCHQTIIRHTCTHTGYSLIQPCALRSIHGPKFKRYTHTSTSACPLPKCGGPQSRGCYSPDGHESVLVNGNTITGFSLYSSDPDTAVKWEAGRYPMAEEGWRPPVPLSAIPGQLLDIVANHLESHCYHRHGEDKAPGLNRMRQHTHWGRGWGWEGTNFRISHAEGDVWGPGEEMPAGLPSAWSNSEGFIFGKTGPVISRNLEGEVAGLLVRLGVRTAE